MDDKVLESLENGNGLPQITQIEKPNEIGLTSEQRGKEIGLVSITFGLNNEKQTEKGDA